MTEEEYRKLLHDVVGQLKEELNAGLQFEKEREAKVEAREESRAWFNIYCSCLQSGKPNGIAAAMADAGVSEFYKRYPKR